MKLKTYQQKVLTKFKTYLDALAEFRAKYEQALETMSDIARDYDFPKRAWEKSVGRRLDSASGFYHSKTNGLNEPLPDVYFKVPTGGGKTLLACHAIDLINNHYRKKQNGLVLWIVPSTQIYRQTILVLKDRNHPYRQVLDISSGGRTLIKEKTERFTRHDVQESLVVLLLMLPSANRQNQDTLRMFKDAGGFEEFFPPEDNLLLHEQMLSLIPNLDTFGEEGDVFSKQIKTSLGNVLKTLKPIVVMDEGHKAYGELARNTIRGFNPSFLLELSATPPRGSNKLVEIYGKQLSDEDMIKLDIHLTNKTSIDWKDTMLAASEKREELEKKSSEYAQETGEYIRPIVLIQVERTGRDQRASGLIHAEDAKEYLIKKCNVPETHIAIKSSEKDDIEGIDLFAEGCDIRYIITKQALQEGWDCSFAYILTILTNPTTPTGVTQLIGRILRQPFARKTHVKELDECYVYTFRQNAAELVRGIKSNLESEGLGDIAGRMVMDDGTEDDDLVLKERTLEYREQFKKFEGRIYLPKFVIQENDGWRDMNFDADILGAIPWYDISLDKVNELVLTEQKMKELEHILAMSENRYDVIEEVNRIETVGTLEVDNVFLARHLGEVIPNPWIAFEYGQKALGMLRQRYNEEIVASNFVFIVEELKKIVDDERHRLAEQVFRKLIEEKRLHFFLITGKGGFVLPWRIKVKSNKALIRDDHSPIQGSLFDYVPEENLNDDEKKVAIYFDEQEQLLWWYRNMSKQDYHIQAWKRHKIYPDFIVSDKDAPMKEDYGNIYVIETKGSFLKNEDTAYKQSVFELCNKLGAKKAWKDLGLDFPDREFEFQVIFDKDWKNRINQMLS